MLIYFSREKSNIKIKNSARVVRVIIYECVLVAVAVFFFLI